MSPEEEQLQSRFLREFSAHESAIHAYVRRLVRRREDALDVMQEVALVLWKKFGDREDPERDFRPWAFGVAKYQVLAWRRDVARDRLVLASDTIELLAEDSDATADQLEREREAIVRHCLAELAPDQRQAIAAMYRPGTSAKNLAAQFGRSVGAFYQWLHRIRQQLSDCAQRVTADMEPQPPLK